MFIAALALSAPAEEPVKLAAPGFTTVDVKPELAIFLNDHFAQQVEAQGLRVVTSKEIGELLGLERQKAMLGCTDTACNAELAGALGVDGMISGSVAHVGGSWKVSLKIVAASSGKPLASFSDQASGEEQLVELYTKAAPIIAGDVLKALNRKAVVVAGGVRNASMPPLTKAALALGATGVAAIGLGTVMFVLAKTNYDGLTMRPRLDLSNPDTVAANGKAQQTAAWVLWGTGAACAVAAGVLFGMSNKAPAVSVSVAPLADGAGFAISGALP